MKPLDIRISISLPDIMPTSMKKAGKLMTEEKTAEDPHSQMLMPNSNRDYLEHTAKKGEDWFDIAEQYGVNGTELQDFNNQFTSVPLHEGMKVKILRHFIKK